MRIRDRFPALASLSDDDLFKQNEYVFRLPDESVVNHERLAKNFKTYLIKYGLLTNSADEDRSLYSLRHTYATFALIDDIPIETIAVQMGTSITMLERHYSKLKPIMKARELSGHKKEAAKADKRKQQGKSELILLTETIKKLEDQLGKQTATISEQSTLIAQLVQQNQQK